MVSALQFVESLCVCASVLESYLVLLLLLLAQVAAVGVILDNVLAHVIHPVHQKLKALLQMVAGRKISACHSHGFVQPSALTYTFIHSPLSLYLHFYFI